MQRDSQCCAAANLLRLGGVAKSDAAGRKMLLAAIADGRAAAKMREIVKAQGGDPRTVDEPELLPKARLIVDVPSPRSGFVTAIDALELGLLGVAMGAGRTRADRVRSCSIASEGEFEAHVVASMET